MPIQTLIAEDNATLRSALADAVSSDPALEVVGVAADAREAVVLSRQLRPQVALLDVRMPNGGGVAATRGILGMEPSPRVIALSASGQPDAIIAMLRAGAVAYLVKGAPTAEIRDAIKRAAHGEATLSAEAARGLIESVVNRLESEVSDAAESAAIEDRVRAVISGAGLTSAFQPIFDLVEQRVVGYEALSRFEAEPRRTPPQWFAEADELGLGTELEAAAIRAALTSAAPALGESSEGDGPFLALNASPTTLLGDELALALGGRLAHDRVVIEVTEHAAIADYSDFARALDPHRERGVRLAVDDVGAGYASLRHILNLDPDLIKLDLSLTRDIRHDRRKRAMAAALISFASETGCMVVAEGIETEADLVTLVELGARYGQGFYLGRPGPLKLPAPISDLSRNGGRA